MVKEQIVKFEWIDLKDVNIEEEDYNKIELIN